MEGETETKIACPVQAPVRGTYCFAGHYMRVASPRRLLQAQRTDADERTCRVLPDIRRVREYLISKRVCDMGAPRVRTTSLRGIGSDFESLRDYEQGDEIRRIDWKATAKHNRLISRNYEIEPDRNVMILVDRGRLMGAQAGEGTKLDAAVDAALMVAAVALDSGDRCGLMTFDRDVAAYETPRAGLSHLPRLVDALTEVQPVLEETHFLRAFAQLQKRLGKRSLILVLSDVIDTDVSRSMMEALLTLNKRHLVVLAALRTPAIQDVITGPSENNLAPFEKAVAYRLHRERKEVIVRLQKGGANVLDVHPEELTVPLVNKYVEIREQNRL